MQGFIKRTYGHLKNAVAFAIDLLKILILRNRIPNPMFSFTMTEEDVGYAFGGGHTARHAPAMPAKRLSLQQAANLLKPCLLCIIGEPLPDTISLNKTLAWRTTGESMKVIAYGTLLHDGHCTVQIGPTNFEGDDARALIGCHARIVEIYRSDLN